MKSDNRACNRASRTKERRMGNTGSGESGINQYMWVWGRVKVEKSGVTFPAGASWSDYGNCGVW